MGKLGPCMAYETCKTDSYKHGFQRHNGTCSAATAGGFAHPWIKGLSCPYTISFFILFKQREWYNPTPTGTLYSDNSTHCCQDTLISKVSRLDIATNFYNLFLQQKLIQQLTSVGWDTLIKIWPPCTQPAKFQSVYV